MRYGDEARQVRRRHEDLTGDLDRIGDDAGPGTAALVVRTVTLSSYPAVAGSTFAVQAVEVTGTESEGTTPTLTLRSGVFYCVILGTAVPPAGTNLLATQAGGRWVARWD